MVINQNKIAFVTGHIGESSTNIPIISKDVDSYFITNNKEISDNLIKKNIFTKVVTINNIPIINSNDSDDNYLTNTMSSKMLKVFPQTFLEKQYDFVVWYDNKFSVNVDDTIRVINSWNNNHSLMLHKHPFLNNVQEEFTTTIEDIYNKKKHSQFYRLCSHYKEALERNTPLLPEIICHVITMLI